MVSTEIVYRTPPNDPHPAVASFTFALIRTITPVLRQPCTDNLFIIGHKW